MAAAAPVRAAAPARAAYHCERAYVLLTESVLMLNQRMRAVDGDDARPQGRDVVDKLADASNNLAVAASLLMTAERERVARLGDVLRSPPALPSPSFDNGNVTETERNLRTAFEQLHRLGGPRPHPAAPLHSFSHIGDGNDAERFLRTAIEQLQRARVCVQNAAVAVQQGRRHLQEAFQLLDQGRHPGVDFLNRKRAAASRLASQSAAMARQSRSHLNNLLFVESLF